MKKTFKAAAGILLLLALFISGCKKDSPIPGPAGKDGINGTNGTNGLPGPIGANGPTGPIGATGPQGPVGNANVISTGVITVNSWSITTTSTNTFQQTTFGVPNITQGIRDKGAVLVYFSNDNMTWTLIPFTFGSSPSNVTYTITYSYNVGIVKISVFSSNGADPGNPGTLYFKVVTIAGN